MIVHVNQIVYVIFSVLITGRYAVKNVAKRVAVVDRKSSIGIGIVSEREHCGTDSRAEYCKFYWIFHRFIWLVQYQKATGVPREEMLFKKCSNSLTINELKR